MQNSVRRVVVGVDGSAGSLLALRRAAGEARRHRARLCPVLVYSSPGATTSMRCGRRTRRRRGSSPTRRTTG
ncbi:universal stress protein [Streptomyces stramineus]